MKLGNWEGSSQPVGDGLGLRVRGGRVSMAICKLATDGGPPMVLEVILTPDETTDLSSNLLELAKFARRGEDWPVLAEPAKPQGVVAP